MPAEFRLKFLIPASTLETFDLTLPLVSAPEEKERVCCGSEGAGVNDTEGVLRRACQLSAGESEDDSTPDSIDGMGSSGSILVGSSREAELSWLDGVYMSLVVVVESLEDPEGRTEIPLYSKVLESDSIACRRLVVASIPDQGSLPSWFKRAHLISILAEHT